MGGARLPEGSGVSPAGGSGGWARAAPWAVGALSGLPGLTWGRGFIRTLPVAGSTPRGSRKVAVHTEPWPGPGTDPGTAGRRAPGRTTVPTRGLHVCHVPPRRPPTGRASQAPAPHLNNPDSQRKRNTRLRPRRPRPCAAWSAGAARPHASLLHARTRDAHATHTRRHVLMSASASRAQGVAQAGAVGPHVCARVRVHREAQAGGSVGTSSTSEGAAGSPGTCPGRSPLLVAPCGEGACGGGAPAQHRPWQPRGTPRGRGPGHPPSVWSRPRAQGWAPHTQWPSQRGCAPEGRGARGQQQQGLRHGGPPLSGAERPRSGGQQQPALQASAAGPLCTGRRVPGPAISRASPPSTRRCSSRCSPRPGEASAGGRPGS